MVKFSNDVDILIYEPALFGELYISGQVLAAGSGGVLSGTSFTASGADFVGAQVLAGGVIYLKSADGVLDGAYEIVSVNSANELTVSVVRSDSSEEAIAPPSATDVSYRVSTYGPQAAEVGFGLMQYFGIRPGDPTSQIDADQILDRTVLKAASVFGVISAVYAMLAGKAGDENFWAKSLHYRRLFEKARQRCRINVDIGSDGVCDVTKVGGSVRLVRD